MDARRTNWRWVVPDEPAGMLVLDTDGQSVHGAVTVAPDLAVLERELAARPPAVAAPDLSAWASAAGRVAPLDVVRSVGAALRPGGWALFGAATSALLRRPCRVPAARLREAVESAGLTVMSTYLLLPDERCPAFLVPADGPRELDHFLRTVFFPYSTARSAARGRAQQTVLRVGVRAALVTPHRLRIACAPSVALLARRSP